MNRGNTSSLFRIITFITIIGGIFIAGCESSRIGPVVPTPNPVSPTPPALTLTGSVVDSKTGSSIAAANVQISQQNGTAIANVVTDNTGAFSYDISSLNQTVLKVSATATGYGSAFVFSKVDLTNRSATVVSVPLDKLTATPVTITTSGGTGSVTSTESKTSQPVTITVPSGGVSNTTTIQVTQVPVNNVPPPASTSNSQVGVANLQPAGFTFAKPVTLSFPLPYQFKAGDQIPINFLTNTTWQNANLTATVDNSGYIANVNITQTNEYSLLDNSKITGSVTRSIAPFNNNKNNSPVLLKTTDILDTRDFTLSGSSTVVSLPITNTVSVTFSNIQTSTPSNEWLFNLLGQAFGDAFLNFSAQGTYNSSTQEILNWPTATNPNALNQTTGQGNAQYPNDVGNWSVVFHLASSTVTWANITITSPYWTATITGTVTVWSISGHDWVWTGHNQGVISYPF